MAQYEVEGQFAANLTVKAREANDDLPSRFSDLRNARIEVHGFAGRNKVEGSDEARSSATPI